MKYKVGDKVKIKSLEWYNANKNSEGNVVFKRAGTEHEYDLHFTKSDAQYCGKVLTIEGIFDDCYIFDEIKGGYLYCDEMIEGLAGPEMVSLDKARAWVKNIFIGTLSDGAAESIAQDFCNAMKN